MISRSAAVRTVVIALVVAAFVLFARTIDLEGLGNALRSIDARVVAAAALLQLAQIALASAQWSLLLRASGARVSAARVLVARFAGYAVGYVTPAAAFGAEIARGSLLVDASTGAGRVAESVIADKVVEIGVKLPFIFAGLSVCAWVMLPSVPLRIALAFGAAVLAAASGVAVAGVLRGRWPVARIGAVVAQIGALAARLRVFAARVAARVVPQSVHMARRGLRAESTRALAVRIPAPATHGPMRPSRITRSAPRRSAGATEAGVARAMDASTARAAEAGAVRELDSGVAEPPASGPGCAAASEPALSGEDGVPRCAPTSVPGRAREDGVPRWAARAIEGARRIDDGVAAIVASRGLVAGAAALAALANIAELAQISVIVSALGAAGPIVPLILFSSVVVQGTLAVLPGNLGGMEGTNLLLFRLLRLGPESALAYTTVLRAGQLVCVAIGALCGAARLVARRRIGYTLRATAAKARSAAASVSATSAAVCAVETNPASN